MISNYPWLKKVLQAYNLDEASIKSFGAGHIHETFIIEQLGERCILQRFNNRVFQIPERISHNHAIVMVQMDHEKLPFTLPLPLPNVEGELFTVIDTAFFRLSPFVSGSCINQVRNPHQAYLAAKAFARFIRAGIHIAPDQFQEVIPGFNDLELRYNQLLDSIQKTQKHIDGELKQLIDFYLDQKLLVNEYLNWKKMLPLRLTHNDTKINNLIFADDLTKVNAVIDLDTLMAGYVYYDFGDLVRTVACTEEESSTAWDRIDIDETKYEALLKGFKETGEDIFTKDELDSLPFGGPMMTCIMGLRFLTDYLLGNIYYTVHYSEQNFNRAKNQMYLLKALKKKIR